MKNLIAMLLIAISGFAAMVSAATVDFATVADTARGVMGDAVGGAGPIVVACVVLVVGIGVVVALLKKIK